VALSVPALTYVRHAMPAVTADVPSTEWHLDAANREAARIWAERLEVGGGIGALVTSTEPKAVETAVAIGECWSATPALDERLREAHRPWIGTGYRAVAHRYLRGELPEGWEPHAEVAERMAAAVHDALAAAGGKPAVVVSHGLALAVHLGDRLGADFDRESFWSRLAFPDAWVLDAGDVLHRSLPAPPPLS
jgi:broad specificity phosphatase PhoE